MSIERELLKRVKAGDDDGDFFISHRLYKDIETFLAQSEQNKAEAIMPNGVRVSNVYDAYEEGRKSVMSEQQPEAWIIVNKETGYRTQVSDLTPFLYHREIFEVIPLYTAPPVKSEQEHVGIVRTIGGYPDNSEHVVDWVCKYRDLKEGDKLYAAPPKREPLSDKEITKNTPKLIHIGERLAFHAGVRFSERHHIIGVNDDT